MGVINTLNLYYTLKYRNIYITCKTYYNLSLSGPIGFIGKFAVIMQYWLVTVPQFSKFSSKTVTADTYYYASLYRI